MRPLNINFNFRIIKLVFAIIVTTFFQSCNSDTTNANSDIGNVLAKWPVNIKDRDYINLLNQQFKGHYFESDTLLLGFILGWTKDQVNAHCNQLISANALGPLQGQSVTVNTMANSYTISTWIGYNYGFQFDSVSRCEGFIDFGFENDSLRFLKYFIRSPYSIQSVKDFIARKYGKPIYSTYNTSISYEEPKLGLVWIRNGKEIQLFEWENYLYLQYSDLKIRLRDELNSLNERIEEKKNDSLEKNRLKKESDKADSIF